MRALVLPLFLIAAILTPDLRGDRLRFNEREFSLEVPDGWRRIPRATIDEVVGEISRFDTTFSAQKIEYALQRRSAEQWFDFPHILIEYTVLDNPWKKRLEEYRRLYEPEMTKKAKGLQGSITRFTRVDSVVFSEQSGVIWVEAVTMIGREPVIRMMGGLVPTPDGLLKIYAYSRDEEYAGEKNTFREIIASAAFGEAAGGSSPGSFGPVQIIMTLIGLAFGALFVLSVKKNLA